MSRSGPDARAKRAAQTAESGGAERASRRFRRLRVIIPVLFLAAVVAAGWHQVAAIDLLRVRNTLRLVPFGPVLGIQLLALLSILAMTPYDLLIAPALGIRRNWRAWVHDAWIANTFNNMVGMAGLTGSGLRYLLAGRDALSQRQAASQAALVMLTIPVGLSALAWPLWLSGALIDTWFSSSALLVATVYLPLFVLLTGDGRLHRRVLGSLPALSRLRQAGLVTVSFLDWLFATLIVWLCIIVAGVDVSATQVLVAYATASLAGAVSMLPGGLGVLDGALFLLLYTPGTDSDALVAGIVMFRVVYYVVPWLIGIYLGGAVLTSGEDAPLAPLLATGTVFGYCSAGTGLSDVCGGCRAAVVHGVARTARRTTRRLAYGAAAGAAGGPAPGQRVCRRDAYYPGRRYRPPGRACLPHGGAGPAGGCTAGTAQGLSLHTGEFPCRPGGIVARAACELLP